MNTKFDNGRIDYLISCYIKHTLTTEEECELKSWTDESPDNLFMLFDLEALANASRPVTSDSTEDILDRIHSKISAEEDEILRASTGKRCRRITWIRSLTAAAVVSVIAAVTFFFMKQPEVNKDAEPQYISYYNDSDDTMTYLLQDGSSVILKPNSRLDCSIWPDSPHRIAMLDGEAFFDIARDTLRPFTVKSRHINVNVLGTAFYVKAFDNADRVEVGLERGSVSITGTDSGGNLILKPNQKAVYDVTSGFFDMETIDVESFIHEKYDITILEDVTASDIAAHIRSTYGIKVTIRGVDSAARFNLSYRTMSEAGELIRIAERVTGGKCITTEN